MRRSTAEAPALDEMVLTDPMGITGNGYTRRGVLGGTAGATLSMTTLAGCGLFDNGPAPDKAADPLQPVLAEALALAAAYDRAVVAQPGLGNRLTPLAADHRAHATELAKVIGEKLPPAASAAPASDAAGTVAGLRKAEQAAQKTAAVACRQAAAARAALVGSIAACRATHAEALR
jgi:hypothetical protein